jgi:hypothetical protein
MIAIAVNHLAMRSGNIMIRITTTIKITMTMTTTIDGQGRPLA